MLQFIAKWESVFNQNFSSKLREEPLLVSDRKWRNVTDWPRKKGKMTVEAWKSKNFLFLSSWSKRKLSRSRECEMLFFISFFWGTRKPEKPWLQQFSNHPILKWRYFQMLCAFHTLWDSLQCAAWVPRCVDKTVESIFFSFYSFPSFFLFFTSYSLYPGTMQSGYLALLDVWSVLTWIRLQSASLFFFFLFLHP